MCQFNLNPLLSREAKSNISSLALITAEAPYRVSLQLDLELLQAIIAAKRSAAEDHTWGLREDPDYFADIVGDLTEHRQEILLNTNEKRHRVLNKSVF